MKKFGAELILSVIIAPFVIWVISSIYGLQANAGMDAIQIAQIKYLLEKQDAKLDNITNILIGEKNDK